MKELFVIPMGLVALRIVLLLLIGFPLIWKVAQLLHDYLSKHVSLHIGSILSHIFFYAALTILVVMILHDLGFNLTALIGAAGVIGIAIGFAAQTTISNILSGIFLLLEQSVKVGDLIEYNGTKGTIESIDLLSVKIKSTEGLFIRVPNESLLKNAVRNLSFYNTRIFIAQIIVYSAANSQQLTAIIDELVKNNPELYKEPIEININFSSDYMTEYAVKVPAIEHRYRKAQQEFILSLKDKTSEIKLPLSIKII